MKKVVFVIVIFILNIFLVNAQLAKVYNEDNLDFDREYRDGYLKDRNYFSNLDYAKVSGGYKMTMKVGGPYYNDYKGINLNNLKKYAFDLISCNSYERYCTFRINGIPTKKMYTDLTFQLDEQYSMKINHIEFDFCDNRAFCHLGYEAYHIVDISIDGSVLPFCGNGVCDYGENCEEDSCCSGKKVDLKYDKENCRMCGYKCDRGYMCDSSRCIEQCPETSGCDYFTNPYCEKTPKNINEECDCNEECSSLKCFNGKCIASENNGLSDYPNLLIKEGKLYVTTVVGDKSSSSNVLAQTYIVSSLSSLGMDINIKNKLASEIKDLNQNIVSIGNPCVNEISAKIMNNPKPCDKDFQRGKSYIKLYKNGDFFHLIIAGYSDIGTKKAAEVLANYENYKFQGNEYIFEFVGDEEVPIKVEEMKKEPTQKNESKEPLDIKTEVKKEQEIIDEQKEPTEKITSVQSKQEQKQAEKSNVISRFISWFLSLFKQKG
ncbi:hypothetical protein HYX05_04430 [Candidatus Woesearchaeota archaeon]|nr:hypothetical protein [Candidatus Woesearchaeota archaeon]